MSPHVKRWVTALLTLPVLCGIIVYGGKAWFAVLITVVSLAAMHEYNGMAYGKGSSAEKAVTMVSTFLILWTAMQGDRVLLFSLLSLSVMTVLMLNLLRVRRQGLDMTPAAHALLGILYIPVLMSHFVLIRSAPSGVLWVFFILVLAFAGDIAAFYTGRHLGKRKLLPEVSPGKTVEGTIGLMIGSIVGCLLFRQWFFPGLAVTHAVVLGGMGSIVGQLGDLCESALKRAAGMKDSGAILPGHGGVLDRLDCLMFIAPFVFYYREFVIR